MSRTISLALKQKPPTESIVANLAFYYRITLRFVKYEGIWYSTSYVLV